MPRIARACPMQRTRCPAAMGALRAKTCKRAHPPHRLNRAARVLNPAVSEWVTGRSPAVRAARIEVHLAAFGKAERRGRTATMDSPVSGPLEAGEAGSVVEVAG